MAVYKIPLSPSPQRFTINLGGTEYGITLRYRNFIEPVTIVDIPQLANGYYPEYSESDLVSFSRNSVATYTDNTGKIVRVEPGVPRFTPSGLLVEGTGYNLIPYSEDVNHTSWTKDQFGSSPPPAISPNMALAPDGFMTADLVEFGFCSYSGDTSRLNCTFSGISEIGVPAAQSVWMKSAYGGTFNLWFRFSGGVDPTSPSRTVTITEEWQRFDCYLASPTLTTLGMVIRTDYTINAGTGPAIHIWGAHRQNGVTQVGTYIPTEGAAITRPAEIATIGHTELANTQGGWVVDITDSTGAALVNGIPLVTGCDLLAQHGHLGFSGELRAQTSDNPDAVATFTNLGEQSHLYWIAS